MNCQNCQQALEAGAAFCGNCGQPVMPQSLPAVPAATTAAAPSYALATVAQQSGERQALLAVLLGVAGIAGALFMALLGLVLGVAGLVMGSLSRSGHRRGLGTVGIVCSALAVVASLGVWAYAIQHDPRFTGPGTAHQGSHTASSAAVAASGLSTPCYAAGFVDTLNISNAAASCDMQAYNGASLNVSTNAYKVYADSSRAATGANFMGIAKAALEKDIKSNLPGFRIDAETVTEFAASPAYVVTSSDAAHHIAVTEAAVLHSVAAGDNVFILVHAANGGSADLSTLEAQWQWK